MLKKSEKIENNKKSVIGVKGMRSFKKFPKDSICPICKTNEDKESVLIPIEGTQKGYNSEAQVFHLDCISLWFYKDQKLIAQKIN